MSADDRTSRRCARAEEPAPTPQGKEPGNSAALRAEFRLGPGVSVILEGDKRTIQADLDFYRGLVERVALTGGDAEASVAALGAGQVKASRRSARHRTRITPSRVVARRGGRKAPPQQVDLDRLALSAFYRNLRPRKGHWSEIVCFVHFLTHHHELSEVGAADVLACFRALRLKRPQNLLPRVNAIKSRTAYLKTVSPGVFALTPSGERFVDSGARPPKRRARRSARRKNARGKLVAASSADLVGTEAAGPTGGKAPSPHRSASDKVAQPSQEGTPMEVGSGGDSAAGGSPRPDVKRGGRRGPRPERKRSPGSPTSSGAHSSASATPAQASGRRRRKRPSSSWQEKPRRS